MRVTQDILFEVTGQSLVLDLVDSVPASVTTSEVFENTDGDEGTAESALSGSAAVSTASTTLDDAAGYSQADPHLLPVAATTGISVGDRMFVTSATGEREHFEVLEVTSGVSIRTRHPLSNDYASSDAVTKPQITHAVDATWVADSNNLSATIDPAPKYRWRVVYVDGAGDTKIAVREFDLVRYSGTYHLTGVDVDAAFPGWIHDLPSEHRSDNGTRLIAEAYRAVKMHLYMEGKADQMARGSELVDDLVLHQAAVLLERDAVVRGKRDETGLNLLRNEYQFRFDSLVKAKTELPFDTDGTGAARKVLRQGLSAR